MGEENEQCLYRNEEVRGQVPETTCNGARTKSAINNTQTPGYVRAPEGVVTEAPSTAPVTGATLYLLFSLRIYNNFPKIKLSIYF